jgi:hypothetical protein
LAKRDQTTFVLDLCDAFNPGVIDSDAINLRLSLFFFKKAVDTVPLGTGEIPSRFWTGQFLTGSERLHTESGAPSLRCRGAVEDIPGIH